MSLSKEPSPLAESLNLVTLIADLMGDLRQLREGTISTRDARVRAELARQILRGVHYVILAQKYLEGHALPAPTGESTKKRGRV